MKLFIKIGAVALIVLAVGCSRDDSLFIQEFLKNPSSVGAIAASSEDLSNAMVEPIEPINVDEYVLELGGGLGSFTQKLVNKIDAKNLFVIENNENFCNALKKKFPDTQIFCIDASKLEEGLPKHIHGKIKYVVSGLPFRSLPGDIPKKIMSSLEKVCAPDATFIQFTYMGKPPLPEEAQKLFPKKPQLYKSIQLNTPPADVWIYKR